MGSILTDNSWFIILETFQHLDRILHTPLQSVTKSTQVKKSKFQTNTIKELKTKQNPKQRKKEMN